MAVDARRMDHHLPSHLIRDLKPNGHLLNTQMDSGLNFQSDGYFPTLCQPPVKTVTCHLPAAAQKKRARDGGINPIPAPQKTKLIDEHTIFQIQQHQSEIDRFVAQHAERVAMEVEKRRRQESRMLVVGIYKGMAKKLKEKDEEIERMGKVNWALQERMKGLCVEKQLWRELAESNEATAKSLRTNLEQVLAEEGESSCGSSSGDERRCRKCGGKESCVLVLPCRHLCLCRRCGSTVHTCPVCNSAMNASVHVNMS